MTSPTAPQRRTAISHILNPKDSSDEHERYSSHPSAQHQQRGNGYQQQHPAQTYPRTFTLIPATWSPESRVTAPYPPHANPHPYSHPGTLPIQPGSREDTSSNGTMDRNATKSAGDRSLPGGEHARWPERSQEMNNNPPSPESYHDPRPSSPSPHLGNHRDQSSNCLYAGSHDAYSPTNVYSRGYAEPSGSSANPYDILQRGERASTRIAARNVSREGSYDHRDYVGNSSMHPQPPRRSPEASLPSPTSNLPPLRIPTPPSQIPSPRSHFSPTQSQAQQTTSRTPAQVPVATPPGPGQPLRSSTSTNPTRKRPTESEPNEGAPAAKRAKASTPKPRNSSTPSTSAPVKRYANTRAEAIPGAPTGPTSAAVPVSRELQYARCMSNRYKNELYPKCVSCTRRWAGDTCRFQNIRYFVRNSSGDAIGIAFTETERPDAPAMQFPTAWNVVLQREHISKIKITIAKALLPVLEEEKLHVTQRGSIHRMRESEVRVTCDTCLTSLFSSTWMCRICGRETCAECFEKVKKLTVRPPGASKQQIAAWEAKRDKSSQSNPFFLNCTKRHEHGAEHFLPVSRFSRGELEQALRDMKALLAVEGTEQGCGGMNTQDEPPSPTNVPELTASKNSPETDSSSLPTPPDSHMPIASSPIDKQDTKVPHPLNSEDLGDVPTHAMQTFTDADLTEAVFQTLWARGEPMVVTGLLSKFKLKWTPEYFMKQYGNQSCLVQECQTETNRKCTVQDFFKEFGQYKGRTECWKLKDWPPLSDFKSAFPDLYDDFSGAVPVPAYVRRDGALNISSHFPRNTVAPDLGPKMYNAMASSTAVGSKGSTRLHMDMADAVNIMTYASLKPDGTDGCAAWDLFRAEDSDKIRAFIRTNVHIVPQPASGNSSHAGNALSATVQHDPIHSQQVYLDDMLRKELWRIHGVKSYRFYQRPGEAVFIPAGCAHQVCNLSDCVKIAIDFVSPENIARCEKLTREFREQNQSMVWKEDVLQLRTMMWFAWLSCTKQEKVICAR